MFVSISLNSQHQLHMVLEEEIPRFWILTRGLTTQTVTASFPSISYFYMTAARNHAYFLA
jgi:hypothetical protein